MFFLWSFHYQLWTAVEYRQWRDEKVPNQPPNRPHVWIDSPLWGNPAPILRILFQTPFFKSETSEPWDMAVIPSILLIAGKTLFCRFFKSNNFVNLCGMDSPIFKRLLQSHPTQHSVINITAVMCECRERVLKLLCRNSQREIAPSLISCNLIPTPAAIFCFRLGNPDDMRISHPKISRDDGLRAQVQNRNYRNHFSRFRKTTLSFVQLQRCRHFSFVLLIFQFFHKVYL